MKLLLDTNIVSKIIRGREPNVRLHHTRAIEDRHQLSTSVIVFHELHYGALRSPDSKRNLERLDIFLATLAIIEPFSLEDANIASKIRADLAGHGNMIGPYDLLIAAQILRLDLILVTGNIREFSRVPGLKWVDWTAP